MMAGKLAITVLAASVLLFGLHTAKARAAGQEIVQFRLTKWKTAHHNDAKRAQSQSATLKQIGCQASITGLSRRWKKRAESR